MYLFIYLNMLDNAAVVDWISCFMTARIVQLTGCACCLGVRYRDVILLPAPAQGIGEILPVMTLQSLG